MPREPQPSPMKNLTGGGGCGCGCLGLLAVAAGVGLLGTVSLEFYDASMLDTAWMGGVVAIVVGALMFLLGLAAWIGSLFME